MLAKVNKTILKYNMLAPNDHVILGLSGGADSRALLRVLKLSGAEYNLKITAVHLNHQIRQEEAQRDEDFVRSVCEEEKVQCVFYKNDVSSYAKSKGLSLEQAGRELRYTCFNEVLCQNNAQKIAVAHNLNDQAETVLMRLMRGSGLWGLRGIMPVRANIIRPLIECSRAEIEDYLRANNLCYVTDSTNLCPIYTRNNLRLNIVPFIEKEINPNFLDTIKRSSEILAVEDDYLEETAGSEFANIVKNDGGVLRIDKKRFLALHRAVKLRIVRLCVSEAAGSLTDFDYGHFECIANMPELESGKKLSLPGGLIVQNSYEHIILYKDIYVDNTNIALKDGDFIQLGEDGLFLSVSYFKPFFKKNYKNICTRLFDYDKIKAGLTLRTRKAGDRIYIDKIGGTKKLKDYFIDNKVESIKRDKILLIAQGGNILWVLDEKSITNAKYLAGEGSKEVYIQLWVH